ncbi:MAG: lycopene cyclase domain-containing protein [Actinomycetales bacterium]|jgi:lycopene cyclase domain-containing protein|nr:MAG: lycopene cyclase domain-containing protein [Actinomycetales bacterium]
MIYTDIALGGVIAAVLFDMYGAKTMLLTKSVFWTSYAIILPFQLVTNWWLTSRNIVMYSSDAIIGRKVCSAPVEDLLFGFALVLAVMSLWVYWGRKGFQPKD